MSPTTLMQTHVSSDVGDFLHQHNAEGAFEQLCELVHECYPQLFEIRAELWDDPEIDDRRKVMLWVSLPESISSDERRAQHRNYHDCLAERVPIEKIPLFGVQT